MKPKDILPDEANSVERDGVTIRKGTLGAFTENIRIIENSNKEAKAYQEAVTDLLELIPALNKLNFFEYYSVKSPLIRELIKQKHPQIDELRRGTLHFICGKIASGKTTLGHKLAKEHDAVFFCEDEWVSKLFPNEIKNVEDYVKYTNRLKAILSVHAKKLLEGGISVVFDFSGNTVNHRKWVRSVFESANAGHKLYLLDVPDGECKRRLAQRNMDKPDGLYWGVSPTEEDYDLFTKYFSRPLDEEKFNVINLGGNLQDKKGYV